MINRPGRPKPSTDRSPLEQHNPLHGYAEVRIHRIGDRIQNTVDDMIEYYFDIGAPISILMILIGGVTAAVLQLVYPTSDLYMLPAGVAWFGGGAFLLAALLFILSVPIRWVPMLVAGEMMVRQANLSRSTVAGMLEAPRAQGDPFAGRYMPDRKYQYARYVRRRIAAQIQAETDRYGLLQDELEPLGEVRWPEPASQVLASFAAIEPELRSAALAFARNLQSGARRRLMRTGGSLPRRAPLEAMNRWHASSPQVREAASRLAEGWAGQIDELFELAEGL